jgi:hypothetical protein
MQNICDLIITIATEPYRGGPARNRYAHFQIAQAFSPKTLYYYYYYHHHHCCYYCITVMFFFFGGGGTYHLITDSA